MAKIRIERAHQLDRQSLRDKAEQLAESLSRDYQLSCRWQGDVLQVQRSGVKGSIALDDQRVRVELSLGLLLSPLSGRLQSEIEAALDKALV
jgi:putative polyhydroxyalkanoate system protein